MRQTAVEWLAETLRFASKELYAEMYEHIEQAKAMEKEQIINANRDGVDMVVDKKDFISGEQYYNETFNNEK